VYIPDHFRPSGSDVDQLLAHVGGADLITATSEGILATFLPLIFEPSSGSPDGEVRGRLMGHLARNNRQWKIAPLGEALVILRGPDAYISPTWYATKTEHGRVVPTWNYVIAHLHGPLTIHDDPEWVEANVRALTSRHEARREAPWSVDDAPAPYIEGQLRAIVGVEIEVRRIEAKWKLSQNRSTDDVDGAVAGLSSGSAGDRATAERMAEARARRGR
jgi:transcriptional regulator